MSADLEKLANYFSKQGDQDLELILRGAALTSRSRNRAASVICSEQERQNNYFGVQSRILDALMILAPKRVGYNYTERGLPKIMQQFHTICGKYLPDNLSMRKLVMPGEEYFRVRNRLTEGQHAEIREKIGQVNDTVKKGWNTTMYDLSSVFGYRRAKVVTPSGLRALQIGDVRHMNDTEIMDTHGVGEEGVRIFRAALSGVLVCEAPSVSTAVEVKTVDVMQNGHI